MRNLFRFYDEMVDVDEDADMHMARHMALGRIPLLAMEFIEYQMPDRVLRQFGILQHIPEEPLNHSVLRTERATQFQRDAHMVTYPTYLDEWASFVESGSPICTEGPYVPIQDYLQWYRRVTKLRIAPCVVPANNKIVHEIGSRSSRRLIRYVLNNYILILLIAF